MRRFAPVTSSIVCAVTAFGVASMAYAQPATNNASRSQSSVVGAREFRLDAGHSDVEFSIGFMMSKVRGRFDGLRGSLFVDEAQPSNSSITMIIDAASINTGSAHRDEHLRSADFFDVKQYPVIRFQSSRVERAKTGFVVRGPLTMHGVTRDVAIAFTPVHPMLDDPHGTTVVTYTGSVRLARRDFGIEGGEKFNPWFDKLRSATMADSVDISLLVSGWITDFARVSNAELMARVARIDSTGVNAFVALVKDIVQKKPAAAAEEEWNFDQLMRLLLFRKRFSDALAIAEMTASLLPNSAQAQTGVGIALEASGKVAAAREAYDRALVLDPLNPQALERRRRLH